MAEHDDEISVAYFAPTSVAEALDLLTTHDGNAKLLAGGQSLLVLKRLGLISPGVLVSLQRIDDLRKWHETNEGGLVIGPMVTQQEIAQSATIRERFSVLSDAASKVASPPVRRRGTLGGNLCHADPTSDPPAALIALGATLQIAGLEGLRTVAVEDLFVDYMETCLSPSEILVSIDVPPPPPRFGSSYLKHRLRGVDTAIVGVGVGLTMGEDDRCISVRIGVAGAASTPFRAVSAEAALLGQKLTELAIGEGARAAADESSPLSDTEASEWYRREMVDVFVRRAIKAARSNIESV